MALTTPTSDATLATNTANVLANRALLTQLAAGEWLPSAAEEIVAAVALLAQELAYLEGQLSGTDAYGVPKTTAARAAWQ